MLTELAHVLFKFTRDALLQVIPTWDGSKLVRKFEPKEVGGHGKTQTHTFELQDNELILVFYIRYTSVKLRG